MPYTKKFQCKHIDTFTLLKFIRDFNDQDIYWIGQKRFTLRYVWNRGLDYPESMFHGMPPKTPHAVALKKMEGLKERKLIDGCPCGCIGTFEITEKGRAWLAAREVELEKLAAAYHDARLSALRKEFLWMRDHRSI
jgi:hypothetical protein